MPRQEPPAILGKQERDGVVHGNHTGLTVDDGRPQIGHEEHVAALLPGQAGESHLLEEQLGPVATEARRQRHLSDFLA